MYKLKLLTALLCLITFQVASAQSDGPKSLTKYCTPNKETEVRGEMVLVEDKPKIVCIGGPLNDQAYFEISNLEMGRAADIKPDEAFFASTAWNNYLKNGMVKAYAKTKKLDPATCKFISKDAIDSIQCGSTDPFDVTEKYKISKLGFKKRYTVGSEAYKDDKDPTKLKDHYEIKLAEVNDMGPKVTTPDAGSSGPLGSDFWDSMELGKQVVFDLKEDQKNLARYSWTDPNLETEKYTWMKQNKDNQIIVVSKNMDPVVVTQPIIVLPIEKLDINLDNPVVKDPIVVVDPIVKVEEGKIIEDEKKSDCKDELNLEIAKLLEDDTKNVIGLQFELTVLKMAFAATGAQTNSLEGLIKKQSAAIKSIDTGVIDKMNAMYKAHGLAEDAAGITEHLKEKSTNAAYFPKDKRFFNQDSSAFLLAYQSLNPDAGIKDADVSVLWFMDKVSEKAKTPQGTKMGIYSSEHNRTNLSTRIAQYTGTVDPSKAITKEKLDEMVKNQKSKIDTEFLAVIESFKQSNPGCYAEIFSDGENDCNVGKIEAIFSELLAVNAKIASADMVSLDSSLKGGIDKTRFKISKYVD